MLGFLGRSCFLFDMSFNWLQIYFFVSHLTEPVPKQRNSREENAQIKEGVIPEAWKEQPNKLVECQELITG